MDRDEAKRQVLAATNLVDLIGEQIALRPKGREHVGLCPFHNDSDPSLNVSAEKQIYKCFSCGAGGDAFSFVMNYHKMSFPEALDYLAERAGIELPRDRRADPAVTDQRHRIADANDKALRLFRRMLNDEPAGQEARDYIARRGISDPMVEAFALGYAPDGWSHLADTVKQRKLDTRPFVEAQLIRPRQAGDGHFDMFRHRLIFPIFDAVGRPIAFGGRKLREEDEPKYLNSPETPLFNKSATLFGLHLAKKTIIARRTAVIVEGYTDVIAAHQAGFANVVATLGTALTGEHVRELRRYCDKVVLVFDADEAGQRAADRALQVFFNEPLDVAVAILPEGQDPADLIGQDDGPARWEAAIKDAADAMAFHFGRVRRAFEAADTLAGKQRIAEDYLKSLVHLGLRQMDPARRGMIMHQIAELLRLDVGTIDQMTRQMRGPARRRPAPPQTTDVDLNALADGAALADGDEVDAPVDAAPPDAPRDARSKAEQIMVGCVLADSALLHATMGDGRDLAESLLPGDLVHLPTRRVYERVYDWLAEHDRLDQADLRVMFEDEAVFTLATDLKQRAERMSDNRADRLAVHLRAVVDRLHQMIEAEADAARRMAGSAQQKDDQQYAAAINRLKGRPYAARVPRTQ